MPCQSISICWEASDISMVARCLCSKGTVRKWWNMIRTETPWCRSIWRGWSRLRRRWLENVSVFWHHQNRDEVDDGQWQKLRLLRLLLPTNQTAAQWWSGRSTTANDVLDLRSLIWGFGKSRTVLALLHRFSVKRVRKKQIDRVPCRPSTVAKWMYRERVSRTCWFGHEKNLSGESIW